MSGVSEIIADLCLHSWIFLTYIFLRVEMHQGVVVRVFVRKIALNKTCSNILKPASDRHPPPHQWLTTYGCVRCYSERPEHSHYVRKNQGLLI